MTTERTLSSIQEELEACIVLGSDVIQTEKLKGADKRENIYTIGVLLNELREQHHSDNEFGEVVSNFFTGIGDRNPDRKIPKYSSTANYRKLPEFGELWECETIGFTNVYKLMYENNEPLRSEIKDMLTGVNPHNLKESKELVLSIKARLASEFRVVKYSSEEVDLMVAHASQSTSPEERTALRQQGAAEEYYRVLDIDTGEYETEAELKAAVKATLRIDERLFHPDRNPDNPEKFREQFERTQRIKEFFGF